MVADKTMSETSSEIERRSRLRALWKIVIPLLGGIIGFAIGAGLADPDVYEWQWGLLMNVGLSVVLGLLTRSMLFGAVVGLVTGLAGGLGIFLMLENKALWALGIWGSLSGLSAVLAGALSGLLGDLIVDSENP